MTAETERLIAQARGGFYRLAASEQDRVILALADALEAAEAEREGLRDVFEAARRLVGLREGCTYDAVVSGLQALKPTAMDEGVFV